jgi:hypothetical protein
VNAARLLEYQTEGLADASVWRAAHEVRFVRQRAGPWPVESSMIRRRSRGLWLVIFTTIAAVGGGCRRSSEPPAAAPDYVLQSVDGAPVPAPLCGPTVSCDSLVLAGSLAFRSDTQVELVERVRTSATGPDSTFDGLLGCERTSTSVIIAHPAGWPGQLADTGFFNAGQLRLYAWRGPVRHQFVYSSSP